MTFKSFDFQNVAINNLFDYVVLGKKNIILQAPTGSGKTAMLIRLMDRILRETPDKLAFIWLTPGAGELEEQQWLKTSQNAEVVKPQYLRDVMSGGFDAGTVTFINWEAVTNKKNIAVRDGDVKSVSRVISEAQTDGVKFIVIIDEEHRNQTSKAREFLETFGDVAMIRASATPLDDKHAEYVKVDEDDVISEHLITREVVLNENLSADDESADFEYFINKADEKRLEIKRAYLSLGLDINPLVLVQFPDEKAGNTEQAREINAERQSLIDDVRKVLVEDYGQDESQLATWLSNEKINIEDISNNNSPVNYLFMKQAVSTGWDAPRAKILIKLRLNSDERFTIQTIGRIRRMPQQKHYDNPLLDNAFVYSNDRKYVSEVLKGHAADRLVRYYLNPNVDKNIFGLISLKRKDTLGNDVPEVAQKFKEQMEIMFGVKGGQTNINKELLTEQGFEFGTSLHYDMPTGSVRHLEDVVELPRITREIPIVRTRNHGLQLEGVLRALATYLHVGKDTKVIRSMMMDLFRSGEQGGVVPQLLALSVKEWYAFMINNGRRLRDVAKSMDARVGEMNFTSQLLLEDEADKYLHVPVELGNPDGYVVDVETENALLLDRNVYDGYSTANFIKQSGPERQIEQALQQIPEVKWFYRSKDRGSDYFSIPYDGNNRDFYPDYLVKDQAGTTYIIETKGASGQNIDEYSEMKFYALKDYVDGSWGGDEKFAFVRPDNRAGILKYNNTIWDEDVENSPNWKPLTQLFK